MVEAENDISNIITQKDELTEKLRHVAKLCQNPSKTQRARKMQHI